MTDPMIDKLEALAKELEKPYKIEGDWDDGLVTARKEIAVILRTLLAEYEKEPRHE
jgi:hypothetical protein